MAQTRARNIRTTILVATAGLLVAGIAVAVIASAPPGASAALPSQVGLAVRPSPDAAAPAVAAPLSLDSGALPSGPASPSAVDPALVAAADALGFRQTTAADVGVVESLPPDTPLLAPSRSLLAVGAAAPDFTLSTAIGERVRLADLRGKTVLLEFFATWCPHCQAEASHLMKMFSTLPGSGFAFLSVNADSEDPASLYAFDRFFRVPWPTLLDQGTPPGSYKRSGGAGPVTRAYGVALYPTFYIIDARGRVAWRNDREQPDLLLSQKLHDVARK